MTAPQMPNTERLKEQARQDFTHGAASFRKWKSQREMQGLAATQMLLRVARVKPGMQVLDVASGAGDPALALAEMVGPPGHVTATDLVPDMLEAAEEFARQRGLANITFQKTDAESLPFPDQAFDVVTCRLGVMFFPNVGQALRETRRVLKPGGRATFIAQGPEDRNSWQSGILKVLRKYVQIPSLVPGAFDQFRFAPVGTLSAAFREAGLRQVQEEYRTIPWPWPGSAEQYWDFRRESQAGRLIERVEPGQRERVIGEVIESIRHYWDGQQVNFTAAIVVASGVR